MYTSHASITVNELGPAKLIDRLAKHWSHKLEVERSGADAFIRFPDANCRLEVQGAQLLATLEADDASMVDKLQGVVAEHLLRMARGETLAIVWSEHA